MNRFHLSAAIAFAALSLSAKGTEPYVPESPLPITDRWRWKELEPLRMAPVVCGAESSDGRLWFGGSGMLIIYDGHAAEEISLPEGYEQESVICLRQAADLGMLVYTTKGLFQYHEETWTKLLPTAERYSSVRQLIAKTAQGADIAYVDGALYQIANGAARLLLQVGSGASSIAVDGKDQLWICFGVSNILFRYQISYDGGISLSDLHQYRLHPSETLNSFILADPSSDEVCAANWRQDFPAFVYSRELDTWKSDDLRPILGSNGHTGGVRFDRDTLALFTKTGTQINYRGAWRDLNYPEYSAPTNQPFAFRRKSGNLIIGGQGEPIYEISSSDERWESFTGLHFQCEGIDKRQWFLSVDGEIVERNTAYNRWAKHTENTIDTPVVLLKARDETIWAAGSHQGQPAVCYYDGSGWTRDIHSKLNEFVSHLSAVQLPDGRLLFGSGGDNALAGHGGVVIYKKVAGAYRHAHHLPPHVPLRPIGATQRPDRSIWFGGFDLQRSASRFDQPSETASSFREVVWIDHVATTSDGKLWAAIWDRGVFQADGESWLPIQSPEQIAGDQPVFLLPDRFKPGQLWVATSTGVSRFDGQSWHPNAMPAELRFTREGGTLAQAADGSIWVNAATRNWYFRKFGDSVPPQRRAKNFGTVRYRPDIDPPRVDSLSYEPRNHSPANIYVSWKASDKWSFTPEKELRYTYRIDQGAWAPLQSRSDTILLNVPKGNHTLQVVAIDADGNRSPQPALASLTVIPPLWQRPWFIAASLAVAALIASLVYLLIRQRIRHLVTLEEFKLQFFTNLSHELRTPLTVILGPLESQLEKLPATWDKAPLQVAYKNAQKMLRLIDQILDFRSVQVSQPTLTLARSDLVAAAREATHLLSPLAAERQQTLLFEPAAPSAYLWFDSEKFEKILSNLVSNAIKYTPPQGRIRVALSIEPGSAADSDAILTVEDNGSGIPANALRNIFDPFYRCRNRSTARERGSGIGLAYTKSLVEAFHGEIRVESPIARIDGADRGTRFTVTLPLKQAPERPAAAAQEDDAPEPFESAADTRTSILIAEDDEDIRNFLEAELQSAYEIHAVENGELALAIARARLPDLVITDLMMPVMDGKELCRRIKSDEETCHIPVYMLTALKSEAHELEGLDHGADDYIAKPVRISILKRRIQNHLAARARLHQLYREEAGDSPPPGPPPIAANPLDQRFLERVGETVAARFSDPAFDVERLAEGMCMSRMTLYRKLKAITGETPSERLKTFRMNAAAAALRTGRYNVSEVADQVGMSDVSHFSAVFKKHFGETPSRYAQQRSGA